MVCTNQIVLGSRESTTKPLWSPAEDRKLADRGARVGNEGQKGPMGALRSKIGSQKETLDMSSQADRLTVEALGEDGCRYNVSMYVL